MRVECDFDLCTGHGRCYTLAPSLFDSDERGHCVVLVEEVPVEEEGNARIAVGNCPEHALQIVE